MKEKVTISIFTPVYNRAKTIQATFESLKRQTVKDFEWIVINDGSSDDSEKIIRNFEGGGISDLLPLSNQSREAYRAKSCFGCSSR